MGKDGIKLRQWGERRHDAASACNDRVTMVGVWTTEWVTMGGVWTAEWAPERQVAGTRRVVSGAVLLSWMVAKERMKIHKKCDLWADQNDQSAI